MRRTFSLAEATSGKDSVRRAETFFRLVSPRHFKKLSSILLRVFVNFGSSSSFLKSSTWFRVFFAHEKFHCQSWILLVLSEEPYKSPTLSLVAHKKMLDLKSSITGVVEAYNYQEESFLPFKREFLLKLFFVLEESFLVLLNRNLKLKILSNYPIDDLWIQISIIKEPGAKRL